MGKLDEAIHTIHRMDYMAQKQGWMQSIHPLSKLLVTVAYIIFVMSISKYDFYRLFSMCIYLFVTYTLGEISIKESLHHLKIILFLVFAVGIANPILDRQVVMNLGQFSITTGMISMITLVIKGGFAVLASYALIITTSMSQICLALRKLHVPKGIVTVILLIYRYIVLLLKEANRMTQAYHLRAPNQKGVAIVAWGSFIGQLLMRSIDRAQIVYESMMLRGYDGEFLGEDGKPLDKKSICYLIFWMIVLLFLRVFPLFLWVGSRLAL